jgi:hypothetical protein
VSSSDTQLAASVTIPHGRGLTDAQRALRLTGVGGSEVAAVLGLATRTTEDGAVRTGFDVWLAKTQGLESISAVDAERGTFLEPSVVDWYMARTGFAKGLTPGTVRHATRPVALCTPDALALKPDGVARLVSVKCPRHGYDWGAEGTDDVPQDYLLQLQWEHAICSSFMPYGSLDARMDLACFVGGELRIYVTHADVEQQGWMLDDVEAWWAKHIVGKEIPPLDASAGCRGHLKRKWKVRGEVREASAVEAQLMSELKAARMAHNAASDAYDIARRRVENAIQDAAGLISPLGVVTWKARQDGVRVFDQRWTKEKK